MFSQSTGVIFINRNALQLFSPNLSSVVTCVFPEALVHDLDIMNKDNFYTLIKQWVKQYNLSGLSVIVVLSEETYFEKLFSTVNQPQLETDILKFFDSVPFESIKTKIFDSPKDKHAIVVNKTWLDTIQQGLVLQGFSIRAVVPAFALGKLSTKRVLDKEVVEYVTRNADALTKQTIIDVADNQEIEMKPVGSPAPQKNKNLPVLLGVFGALLLILVIVFVLQFRH